MAERLRFLMLGDVVGRPGRAMFQKWARSLKEEHKAHAIIVNGENSGDAGRGITSKIIKFFRHNGADVITTGNHIWYSRDVYATLDERDDILRPANYPSACPGKGHTFFEVGGHVVAVINVQGRVFMHEHTSCPFQTVESLLPLVHQKTKMVLVDFHAEATSEKQGLGYFLDGKVSAVVGTHTHVPTADEKILPGGTAYVSDLGFSGGYYSMLGMAKEEILRKFLTQMPSRFRVETTGPMAMTGVVIELDTQTGKATSIERVKVIDEDIQHSITDES